ncbi:hypothetical protein BMG00_14695 [Thioclava marina]|uniref:Putative Flp pilus-assembly TadG-like N-terminal domain-containing protein n=1 Tax=Thioclava marina TaxID=1915077 RepID=A0ABX3MHK7_9RHOB|nr:TadE/TadG family type IV pilus assembly protein [Thioclava marina]OOY10994.1 hypothetical protein BMG00_14695 [Thioclava marina]
MARIRESIRRFAQDEDGTILVFFGMSLVILFGLVALSFDLGRLGSTRSELQSYADSVALAAAGELDGNSDAISRANSAAALVSDTQTFGAGGHSLGYAEIDPDNADGADVVSDVTLTYLSRLPKDTETIADVATTEPAKAAFVHAAVARHDVSATFAAVFTTLGGFDAFDGSAEADAIAGLEIQACDVTPLMFCVPPGFKASANIGTMVRIRAGGSGAAWGPGDFGFLDPDKIKVDDEGPCAKLNGAHLDACLLGAQQSITQCFNQRGVDTEPGQKEGLNASIFNVRFDMYQAIMNGLSNDEDYAPAPNVIKGIIKKDPGNSSNQNQGQGKANCIGEAEQVSPDTVGLPRDDCFMDKSCDRFGDGDWSEGRETYVATNYGAGVDDPHPDAVTRYDYYLAEIKAAAGGEILTDRAETGLPTCAPAASSNPDRRVLIVAGIDCSAETGAVIKGAMSDVPVKEFVKVFLTEPVGEDGSTPPVMDIWGEIIGSASDGGSEDTGTGGIVRDVVQLYR